MWSPSSSTGKKLLDTIDRCGYLPLEINLAMTDEFRQEVNISTGEHTSNHLYSYPAGKKGATEIEEMSQRIEALALK